MQSEVTVTAAESPAANGYGETHSTASYRALLLGSIGVVYGDIGTSPLYAFREAVTAAASADGVTPHAVIGVISLIIWALIVVVTLKYVLILMRADNNGEGGTLALMALAQRALSGRSGTIVLLGIISGALFYGDAVITPALSVLSAIEGIKIATEAFDPYVVPLTLVILLALFAVQSRGTARVAAFFGPIMAVWFAIIGLAALPQIARHPEVLMAFNPFNAVSFMLHHGVIGLVTLGAVFLAVTGAEALYADLGHFGKRPIQSAWLCIVLPSLALNYLGQGALVIANPKAIENPFYLMFPDWALLPMVAMATVATVIASQAVITGAYSLTRQAIQLGLLPRFEIRHTSESHAGQIYIPRVNTLLLVAVVLLVVLFRSSSALASAYGISVTGTMVVTALMGFVVIWKVWRWSAVAAAALIAPFLLLDLTFLGANLLKVFEGGWVPLALGGVVMLLMYTWRRGSRLLFEKSRKLELPLADLVAMLEKKPPQRVPGTAVFLTSDPLSAPTALMHSLKHYKVLHEKNVILTIETASTPRIDVSERVRLEQISPTFSRVALRFGFMETPNVPKALAVARKLGWQFDIMSTSFFLSRRALKPAAHSGMPRWQDHLFIALSRSANDATDYFQIPTGRVVEVGTQVSI
ncbi:potassium transporter Kup [Bradyrhizobium sp. U87765 SZCCT0131]|uniref:potassium transporter Kup n=1 Tax=unclassified Bradyrhizobium TaxID=2631580 RepID=UPI001BA5CE5F|nr:MULTISPECIES: potassium transporter Kup [unclassified Bradyrhizobium]MBR1221430.1 potassium transporter Kup [Bradyrhizobium sp. U87765 SZCCT0131]MBR1264647.1 potassium transporter Kup [Bradyrhizobium sp. U87765 SZCCT0134]MBR1304447.1 potassium transporter Kup [Bradyrhizobium sp. U87765 SZCCT0110]MBR1322696.1 potassium transporter Kup [Bradyrhizobium sp. U87765 SZCCT0109]MBR1346376.1 potassium transporter Kup [Bradyrhizobium sp. U87765 SZCCT0048]